MIYKILAILAIVGMAGATMLPSDLIVNNAKPGVINLSGADFDKIFGSPTMQLQSLGLPPRGWASDLRINPKYTLEPLINWSRQEPAEL
jgi:hypothetical protein